RAPSSGPVPVYCLEPPAETACDNCSVEAHTRRGSTSAFVEFPLQGSTWINGVEITIGAADIDRAIFAYGGRRFDCTSSRELPPQNSLSIQRVQVAIVTSNIDRSKGHSW